MMEFIWFFMLLVVPFAFGRFIMLWWQDAQYSRRLAESNARFLASEREKRKYWDTVKEFVNVTPEKDVAMPQERFDFMANSLLVQQRYGISGVKKSHLCLFSKTIYPGAY